jgi:hypothetical protein
MEKETRQPEVPKDRDRAKTIQRIVAVGVQLASALITLWARRNSDC